MPGGGARVWGVERHPSVRIAGPHRQPWLAELLYGAVVPGVSPRLGGGGGGAGGRGGLGWAGRGGWEGGAGDVGPSLISGAIDGKRHWSGGREVREGKGEQKKVRESKIK